LYPYACPDANVWIGEERKKEESESYTKRNLEILIERRGDSSAQTYALYEEN
jgi:hypothetical protein